MKCKKPLKSGFGDSVKKRPADLSIIKRLGRFYWCKDNGNSWNDKDMLNLGLTDA